MQRPGPYFKPYLIDRFARIFTAYVPVLILVAVVNRVVVLGHWGQPGVSTGFLAFFGNLTLLQEYPLFQAGARLIGTTAFIRSYNTAEPFWTIPIEFWIYVVFGFGCFGLAARERLGPVAIILAAIALPVAVWNAAAGGGSGLSLVWLAGAMAAYLWVTAWRHSHHKLQLGLVTLALGAACLAGRGMKLGWDFQDLGMVLCEAVMLLGTLSVMEAIGDLPRALRGACKFLASYSFSLYLVHNTVLVVARVCFSGQLGAATLPVALVASHVVAFTVYILFERHYRRVGQVLRRLTMDRGLLSVPTAAAIH